MVDMIIALEKRSKEEILVKADDICNKHIQLKDHDNRQELEDEQYE